MKKNYLLWLVMALFSVLPVDLQAQYGIVLEEGFEGGIVPPIWSQDNVEGSQSWVVERDGIYPTGAFEGEYRIAIKNPTSTTIGYRTKLISPPMDLTGIISPVLNFAYANDKWAGDFDHLTVYYRVAPEQPWVVIERYDRTYAARWTEVSLDLPRYTETTTYQVAFEAFDRLGRGVVIDDIVVRSKPVCNAPSAIMFTDIANTTATMVWAASFDAVATEIKVSSRPLNADSLADGTAVGDILDERFTPDVMMYNLTGLDWATQYYVYARSVCGDGDDIDYSVWAPVYKFTTLGKQRLPYVEHFDMPVTEGFNSYQFGWTYGATEGSPTPGVSTGVKQSATCAWSADCTPGLVFAGAINYNYSDYADVAAAKYAYAVTPELSVDSVGKKIQDITVSFWSKRVSYSKNSSLIVGVMTDPKEISTFEPVDTVAMRYEGRMEEFIVSLENYTDTGKFVAFMSDFDDANFFFLDDLTIDYTPDCPKPTDVKLIVNSATDLRVQWNAHGKSSADIVISSDSVAVDKLDPTKAFKYIQNASTNPVSVSGLSQWTKYYVYVRTRDAALDCHSEWSSPVEVLMPTAIALEQIPDTFRFEYDATRPDDFYKVVSGTDYSGNKKYAWLDKGILLHNLQYGKTHLRGEKDYSYDVEYMSPYVLYGFASGSGYGVTPYDQKIYAVFPELPVMPEGKHLQAVFWISTSDKVEAVIVDDANNPEDSYTVLATLPVVGKEWKRIVVPMDGYKGSGRFFALRYGRSKGDNAGFVQFLIDNLSFEEMPDCQEPDGFSFTPDEFSASLSWNANEAAVWEVRLATAEVPYDSLDSDTYEFKDKQTVNGTPSVSFSSLEPNLTSYYAYVRAVCGDFKGAWVPAGSFLTDCTDKNTLPYYEDFNAYSGSGYYNALEFPVPCITAPVVDLGSDKYPRIYPYYNYPGDKYGEGAALNLYSKASETGGNVNYIILPGFITSIDSILVEFQMRAAYNEEATLLVGVVTDRDDISTFQEIGRARNDNNNQWEEHTVVMSGYKGNGGYIALLSDITKAGTSGSEEHIYIDNISLTANKGCLRVASVEIKDIEPTTARIDWTDRSAEMYDVVVSTRSSIGDTELASIIAAGTGDGVALASTVAAADLPYLVSPLVPSTQYYVYVRSNCGAGNYGLWIKSPAMFRTACSAMQTNVIGVEDFEGFGNGAGTLPQCWVVGNAQGKDAEYVPYISTKYSHSGTTSLQIASTEKANQAYAISPKIDIDDIRRLEVSFYGYIPVGYCKPSQATKYQDYQRQLIVGVSSDPDDMAKFVPIDTITGYDEELPYTVRFDEYEDVVYEEHGKYVMFYSSFAHDNYFFIDDVRFDSIAQCPAPAGIRADVTATSVDLTWRGGTAPYTVKYAKRRLSADELNGVTAPDDLVIGSITAPAASASITGLDGHTDYYIYIASTCADGLSDWSTVRRITTDCYDLQPLPFSYNFDGTDVVGEYTHPSCWISHYSRNEELERFPSLATGGRQGNCVYFYTYGKYVPYLVSPELDVDNLRNVQVSFFARGAKGKLAVGVVEDATSDEGIDTTFVALDTIDATASYTRYCIKFENYDGKSKRVAFRGIDLTGYTMDGLYIDDVYIEEVPTCPKPDYLTLEDLSDSYAVVSFKELDAATAWQVAYGKSGFDVTIATPEQVDDTEYRMTGLDANTRYDFYVRSVCDAAAADGRSNWAGPLSFTTTMTPVEVTEALPYSLDFADETENARWQTVNGVLENQWVIGDSLRLSEQKPKENALYISCDNGASASYNKTNGYAWAVRTIRLEKGQYTFNYKWAITDQTKYNTVFCMRVGLLPVAATMTAGSNQIIMPGGEMISLSKNTVSPQFISLEGIDAEGKEYGGLTLNGRTDAVAGDWNEVTDYVAIDEASAGTYNVVVFFCYSGGYSDQIYRPSAAIDDLNISFTKCIRPANLKKTAATDATLDITWDAIPDATEYEMWVVDGKSDITTVTDADIAFRDTVTTNSCHATGLQGWTTYHIFVRNLCGGDAVSDWSEPINVKLPCGGIRQGTKVDMETENGTYTDANGSLLPDCFVGGNMLGNDCYAKIQSNLSTGKVVARSGKNALYLGGTQHKNNKQYGDYIVLPPVADDADMDTLQLSFWMRPVTHDAASLAVKLPNLFDYHSRTVTVGYMTDPDNPSTFVGIKDCVYPYDKVGTHLSEDRSGNNYWVPFTIRLEEGKGRYLAIYNKGYAHNFNHMYVDDIAVDYYQPCVEPNDLTVSDITDHSARISFDALVGEGDRWQVLIARNDALTDTVLVDTITSNSEVIDGLTEGKSYYVAAKKLCSVTEQSAWSVVVPFSTDYATSFDEDFERAVTKPEYWYRGVICSLDGLYQGDFPMEVENENYWHRSAGLAFEGSPHYMVGYSGNAMFSDSHWLFTPVITVGNAGHAHLVFDLAMTESNSELPLDHTKHGSQYISFNVVVSYDGGQTWSAENTTVWNNNATGDYTFDSIPAGSGRRYRIDLPNCKGKDIKVGFFGEDRGGADKIALDIHIDNVHINAYSPVEINDDLCANQDYYSEVFSVTSDKMTTGVNEFDEMKLVYSSLPDTVYEVTLNVAPEDIQVIEKTICEGVEYNENGFAGLTKADTYRRKEKIADSECVRIVQLELSVIAAIRDTVFDTICSGGNVVWNGNKYTNEGYYDFTTEALSTECDSITTLALHVNDPFTLDTTIYLCKGDSYIFDGEEYTNDGSFDIIERSANLKSYERCDSIVNLTLIASDTYNILLERVVCSGSTYTGDGFVGVATEKPQTLRLKSQTSGCDSVVTLQLLMIADGETRTVERTISTDQLPYDFHGETFDAGTDEGIYERTVEITSADGCKASINLRLTIGEPKEDALDMPDVRQLVLSPNPVEAGGVVYANLELANYSRVLVELFDAAGQCIDRFVPDNSRIVITAPNTQGVYLVRITCGDGCIYMGRIMVE